MSEYEMSAEEFKEYQRTGVLPRRLAKPAPANNANNPKNKYGAVKTEVDGITFDSKAEARRYEVLKLREQEGGIHTLMLQPRFPLHVIDKKTGEKVRIGYYVGDFMYMVSPGEEMVLEDVKGVKTPLYNWKKRHVEAEHGIKVTEVS